MEEVAKYVPPVKLPVEPAQPIASYATQETAPNAADMA